MEFSGERTMKKTEKLVLPITEEDIRILDTVIVNERTTVEWMFKTEEGTSIDITFVNADHNENEIIDTEEEIITRCKTLFDAEPIEVNVLKKDNGIAYFKNGYTANFFGDSECVCLTPSGFRIGTIHFSNMIKEES
jgi:hypothetical protein